MNLSDILKETNELELIVGPFITNRIRTLIKRVEEAENTMACFCRGMEYEDLENLCKTCKYWDKWMDN